MSSKFIVFYQKEFEYSKENPSVQILATAYYNTKGHIVVGTHLIDAKNVSILPSNPGVKIGGRLADDGLLSDILYELSRDYVLEHNITDNESAEKAVRKTLAHVEKEKTKKKPNDKSDLSNRVLDRQKERITIAPNPPKKSPRPNSHLIPVPDWLTMSFRQPLVRSRIDTVLPIVVQLAHYAGKIDPDTEGNTADKGKGTLQIFIDNDISGLKLYNLHTVFCENDLFKTTACARALLDDTIDPETLLSGAFDPHRKKTTDGRTADDILQTVCEKHPRFKHN